MVERSGNDAGVVRADPIDRAAGRRGDCSGAPDPLISLGRPVEPPLVAALNTGAVTSASGLSSSPSAISAAMSKRGREASTEPSEIRIGVSAKSSTVSASCRGRRHDSICGVAPAFHRPNAASRKPAPLGRAMETTSPSFTPALARPRAIWLVRRSNWRQVTVWSSSVIAGASGFSPRAISG